MNNLAMVQALVFEPRTAFAELDARPRFWWPLLVVCIGGGVLAFWYTSVVDLEWLVHHQMSNSSFGANMTDEEIARLGRTAADQQGFRAVLSGIGNALGTAVGLLISALYFILAGKVTGVERSFRHWLSLSAWISLPMVLGMVAGAFVVATASTRQIPQESLQPLSLNELIFRREQGETGFMLLSYISVLHFVALYLGTVAVKLWSGRTWLFSFLFNALPLLIVFCVWAVVALR